MKPSTLILAALCLTHSACFAAIAGAVQRGNAHDAMEEAVRAAATEGDAALAAAKHQSAAEHFGHALAAVLAYHYRYNYSGDRLRRSKATDLDVLRKLVADSDGVVSALEGLIRAYREQDEPALAAAVADLLPEDKRNAMRQALGIIDATVVQAKTAPDQYAGQLVYWWGEITQARYDEAQKRMLLVITPTRHTREQRGWTRRNVVDAGGSRWETIPNWVSVKHLVPHDAFAAVVRGYDRELVRGRYVGMFGRIGASSTSQRIVLDLARPSRVLGDGLRVSVLGHACRKPWTRRCLLDGK